ncbi:MAG: glycosyl transferase family 1 [Alphaproteobacteria bacterium]|nr:glycosyl transferase family 1 [Alphaproteobacteria bacterium]
MLQIDNVTYRIGDRVLLENANVTVPDGHRIGLVGRNGTGKTTLLKLIQGQIEADEGSVSVREKITLAAVSQQAPTGTRSPLDVVLAAHQERDRLLLESETAEDPQRIAEIHTRLADIDAHTAPARAASILSGLGFDQSAQNAPLDSFSGGWQMRVALAAALFPNPDLLLLDEPTNHLDYEATLWFERYLASYANTVIVVSHDRSLLNKSVNHILHLRDRQLKLYRGTYDTFERTHREHLDQQSKLRQKQNYQRHRIERFVERFRYKAMKAKQAQSRLKALERMEPIASVVEERTTPISFPNPESASPALLVYENAAVGYEPHSPVLSEINLRIDPGDRIALLGANGNGKSTFARLVSDRLSLQSGKRARHRKFTVGYFAQHQLEELSAGETAVEAMGRQFPRTIEQDIRTRLGTFGFSKPLAETPIRDLSGGEKARLLLAFAGISAPQLLVLDEPTNHLDVDARESLVHAINEFEGAVILITHDRHIVELCADHLWIVENGTVTPFEGSLDDYERLTLHSLDQNDVTTDPSTTTPAKSKNNQKKARRQRAEKRMELAPYRRAIAESETLIDRLTEEKQKIERLLSESGTHEAVGQSPSDMLIRLAEIDQQLLLEEKKWVDATEFIEAAGRNDL